MRIEQIQRHLHCIEHESVLIGDFEHIKVNVRILMSREADVTNLARCPGSYKSGVGSIGIENAVRIFVSENFVMLNQVYVIDTESL